MPTYVYRCRKCAHEYEKREGFDAPARQRCPSCRGSAQRVPQAPPIVFKGSGFYITDSRESSPKESEPSKDSSDTSTTSSDASKVKSDASKSKDADKAATS